MNTKSVDKSVNVSGRRFAVVNGKMQSVRDPRPIELQGLVSKFSIKPWTNREERSYRMADVKAAQSSLNSIL